MPFLSERVLDFGLSTLDTEATHLHILGSEPATFAAVTAGTLGNATVSIPAPAARTPSGRKVVVPAITAGAVTATGSASATHWAIVDATNSRLLAANALAAPQTVTNGNQFSLSAFDIGLPGAA